MPGFEESCCGGVCDSAKKAALPWWTAPGIISNDHGYDLNNFIMPEWLPFPLVNTSASSKWSVLLSPIQPAELFIGPGRCEDTKQVDSWLGASEKYAKKAANSVQWASYAVGRNTEVSTDVFFKVRTCKFLITCNPVWAPASIFRDLLK